MPKSRQHRGKRPFSASARAKKIGELQPRPTPTSINLIGNETAQRIIGNNGANVIIGGGNVIITSFSSNDVIYGGAGKDTPAGGAGYDTFAFNTANNFVTNVERITDFNVAQARCGSTMP